MSTVSKDPAIKLFGRTIPLPDCRFPTIKSGAFLQTPNNSDIMVACSEIAKAEGEETTTPDFGQPYKSSALRNCKDQEEDSLTLMNETQLNPKSKKDQVETNSGDDEEVFKKLDKILPCPRCKSYDTKFCYFNNYNVNQPRHYCRKCQRYWTAGGTMRNVPIGAGRRKNKPLASQYCQVMVSSDTVPISQMENLESASHELLACGKLPDSFLRNGAVQKVGSEAPSCESMENVFNLRDHKRYTDKGSANCGDNGEEPSCGSSVTVSSFSEPNMPEKIRQKEQGGLEGSCNNLPPPHHLNCYPIPPWVLPSNIGWNNGTHLAPMMAVPGFSTSGIPLQFVPASFLGCGPIWPRMVGNINMAGVNTCPSPSSSISNGCSGNGSPTLGKHPREVYLFNNETGGNSDVVAKTLRIDEPEEALKIPTCAPLGMKPDQTDHPKSKCDIFVAFDPKAKSNGHLQGSTRILEANLAALSCSQTFQEIT